MLALALATVLCTASPWLHGPLRPASCVAFAAAPRLKPLRETVLPEGSALLPVENLEGALLLRSTLRSVHGDTTGALLLDTGAGFLALDFDLAVRFGMVDSTARSVGIGLSDVPVLRMEIGSFQMDQVAPVLIIDAGVVRRVTDRDVLGLLGYSPLRDRAVVVDYADSAIALIPGGGRSGADLSTVFTDSAVAIPFRLAADGKIVVGARLANRSDMGGDSVTLIVDTGATKTILFEPALSEKVPASRRWRKLRGLFAPTLLGADQAGLVRVPVLRIDGANRSVISEGGDAAVMTSDLAEMLSGAIGEPIDGLLGYSFLRHYRVAIDYPGRTLWLEPRAGGQERRWEWSNIGLQIERVEGAVRVIGVIPGAPAHRAGVAAGDELLAVDGASAATLDVLTLARMFEGPPGSRVTLRMKRGAVIKNRTLVRRRLL